MTQNTLLLYGFLLAIAIGSVIYFKIQERRAAQHKFEDNE